MVAKNERVTNPTRTKVVSSDGRKATRAQLASIPLVAYQLNCGHLGRNYAVQKREVMFCAECGSNKQVKKILAQ